MEDNWRPSNWVNPHASPDAYYLYEKGADEMLKACRENWRELVPDGYHILSDDEYKIVYAGLEIPKL